MRTQEPKCIPGNLFVDDRGEVSFVNDFDFMGVKRFYTVTNHRSGFVRAWHGHKVEAKYCLAISGSFLVCCIKIDNWESPSQNLPVSRFVLSENSPAVLCIPPGYVNGFMSLAAKAKMLFLSSSTLHESEKDDFRFPARHWDPWSVKER
jgi:dTDP-4-dehydrorhamnose 3,5-epimerase-like enzyme